MSAYSLKKITTTLKCTLSAALFLLHLSSVNAEVKSPNKMEVFKRTLGAKEGDYKITKNQDGKCSDITLAWVDDHGQPMLLLSSNNFFRHINSGKIEESESGAPVSKQPKCKTEFTTTLENSELKQVQSEYCQDKLLFQRERSLQHQNTKLFYKVIISDLSDNSTQKTTIQCEYSFSK